MTFIIITIAILFIILLIWNWHNLVSIDKSKKILYSIIEIIVLGFITFVIYQISKSNIQYPNDEARKAVRNMLIILFTGINGCILLPYISRTLSKLTENEIDTKSLRKRLLIIVIALIIISIIETSYMASIQQGTLDVVNKLREN